MTTARTAAIVAAAALASSAVALPAAADTTAPPDPALKQKVTADEPTGSGKVEIGTGHVDIGPRLTAKGWELMARDDTAATPTWRHLDDVLLRVHDAGRVPIPEDPQYSFLKLDKGANPWVVPQTQNPKVVWLGWNTQDPGITKSVDRGVTLNTAGLVGPGSLNVFLQNGFDKPQPLWHDALDQPLWVDVNTHTHANWVFSKPGAYVLSLRVTAKGTDGATHQATGSVRFAVGDAVTAKEAFAVKPAPLKGKLTTMAAKPTAAEKATDAGTSWPVIGAAVGGALALLAVAVGVMSARGRAGRRAAGMSDD